MIPKIKIKKFEAERKRRPAKKAGARETSAALSCIWSDGEERCFHNSKINTSSVSRPGPVRAWAELVCGQILGGRMCPLRTRIGWLVTIIQSNHFCPQNRPITFNIRVHQRRAMSNSSSFFGKVGHVPIEIRIWGWFCCLARGRPPLDFCPRGSFRIIEPQACQPSDSFGTNRDRPGRLWSPAAWGEAGPTQSLYGR